MEYKGATIQTIKEILPIDGCDNIELAKVLGWQCIVKKGEFKSGDRCVYIEIDSLLPIKPEYEFLRKSCHKKLTDGTEWFKIKTIKMKGQLSQGLVLSMDTLPPGSCVYRTDNDKVNIIGGDVSKLLGVVHYEKPAPTHGDALGDFPNFITKTDEVRVQSYPELLTSLHGKPYYITTKLDGTSATYYYKDGHFGVCSRNLELEEIGEGNVYWKMARKYRLEEQLKKAFEISKEEMYIQGEIVGVGIQNNPLNLSDQQFFVFNIGSLTAGVPYSFNDIVRMTGLFQLQVVHCEEAGMFFNSNLEQLIEKSKGKYIGTEHNKEGIVIRATDQTVSFKVVNNEYLLKEEN